MELVLERREQENRTPVFGGLMLTPQIDDNYWAYRVRLSEHQAVVAFPKFATVGVGFTKETDRNTNLPYFISTLVIWEHIKHNKGDAAISDDDCIRAIEMVRGAVAADKAQELIEERNQYRRAHLKM